MSKIILPSTNINSVDDPAAGYIVLVGDSTNGIKAKDENGDILPIISGTPGYGVYFNGNGEVDGNSNILIGTSSSKIQNSYNSFLQVGDELDYTESALGVLLYGSQMVCGTTESNISMIVSSSFSGQPVSLMGVYATSGQAQFISLWDDTHEFWKSSISSERTTHDVRGFVSVDSSATPSESRIEVEVYNESGRKSTSKWYIDCTHISFESPTYSMGVYLNEERVSMGNLYDDRNSTKLIVSDIDGEIRLETGTISINGLTGYSGTYSADGQIVTVTNGLITSVV